VKQTVLEVGKTTGLRWALLVAATLLVCGAVLGSAAAAPCGTSWTTVPSAPELRAPRAIVPVAPDDIWIVGHRSLGRATGAEHWDGNTWTVFPTPNAQGTQNALLGADAPSSDDVWAVGYSKPRGYRTLVERWNGTSWKVVQSPNVGTESNALVGVDVVGPDLAWAVGYYRQDKTHRKTLILRWDGASWSVVPSPSPGSLSNALLGIAAVDEDNIWAVGYKKSSGAGYRSLVLRYDGTAWTEVKVPTAGDGDNVLTGVSAVPGGEVWAAGYLVSGTRHKALTLRHDGVAWDRVPSANGGEDVTALRDIDASSPTDAWAVGLEYRANRDQYAASTQRWDGSSWTAVPSAISQSSTNKSEMLAVAKAPGTSQVWAAGQPANVETICPSGGTTASTSSQEPGTSTASAVDSARVPERPGLPQIEAPVSSPSAEKTITATAANAVDKAADAGISELTKTRGAIIADFDNDGLKDIFLNRHQLPARLYINDGDGHFTETNEGTFGRSDRHGCDAADVNNDGLKDIFCPEGAALGTQATRSELYLHQPGHTFVDQAARYGVFQPFARGRSGTFIKANGDAYPDLFAANDENRADGLPSPNRLFINQAGSAYRHAPEFGLEHEVGDGASTGGNPDVGDLDKDGWQDLLVETAAGLRVYHNKRGNGFTDVATSVGLGHDPKDAILADVNGDTWLDVVEVFDNELRVMLNTTGGRFSTAFSAPLSLGLAVAAGDVNGDNRADIYVMRENDGTGANAPDQVYLNDRTGKDFVPMPSIPSTTEGTAESVWPIDHDGNGLTDFLVLNGEGEGGNAQGPVQLIAFFPAH
jgi:hypothetical protein